MQMGLGNRITGAARDPWHLPPGQLAPQQIAPGRPTWQVTRWPVDRAEYDHLVEAARQPDMMSFAAGSAVADAAAPVTTTPTIGDNFDGVGRTALDPPDPALAVGPDDVMTAVNAEFAIASKSAPSALASVPFSALFGPVLPRDANFMFDPKLAYDHFAKRWIVIVGAKRETPRGSWIMLAVSQTSDPRGSYYTWALDAALDGTKVTANWADYPTLGFDEQAIYVAVNMFQFGGPFQYTKLRILNKSEVYVAPGAVAPALRWYDISVILNPDHRTVFTLQPAVHYRAARGPAYFVNALWPSGGALTVWTLTNPLNGWKTPPAAPAFTAASVACQTYDLPPAAVQRGSATKITTDDSRLLNAVYHGDGATKGLWTTHTSKFTWPGESEARAVAQWYQLDVTGSKVVQQGRYGAPGVYHFFPAIQTIANGDAFMVFSRSSASDFPQLRATGRQAADPPGTLSNSVVVQAGASAFPGTRWGDYFSVARDPGDEGVAWMVGEYVGPGGDWATRICSVFF
ncbi:MAG TPA: hypothetical protein VGC72_02740 [Candidatus Elarobacter sp.]|jgi:hypothetical protein